MFNANGYPGRFFHKLEQQFHSLNGNNHSSVDTDQTSTKSTHEYRYLLVIPYFGKDSRRFVNKFSTTIRN